MLRFLARCWNVRSGSLTVRPSSVFGRGGCKRRREVGAAPTEDGAREKVIVESASLGVEAVVVIWRRGGRLLLAVE
jgi:hypothetical protein